MEEQDILKKAGLSSAQSEIYSCLLKNGVLSPAELAEKTTQSRENCYAIAKKLEEFGLIKSDNGKKLKYQVLNPSAIETLVEKRRKVIVKNEKIVKDNISTLLDMFYANNEMPGARTLEGIDGIKEVFKDTLRVKKDVYFIRTVSDATLSGEKGGHFLHDYRNKLPHLGIHTYALTPINKEAMKKVKSGRDKEINFHRTWMPESDYTAPVEIQVYGDKVALISFGETQMATVITSPTIAEAMRQILKLLMDFYQKDFKQEY